MTLVASFSYPQANLGIVGLCLSTSLLVAGATEDMVITVVRGTTKATMSLNTGLNVGAPSILSHVAYFNSNLAGVINPTCDTTVMEWEDAGFYLPSNQTIGIYASSPVDANNRYFALLSLHVISTK